MKERIEEAIEAVNTDLLELYGNMNFRTNHIIRVRFRYIEPHNIYIYNSLSSRIVAHIKKS